jgi:hypothetical protein
MVVTDLIRARTIALLIVPDLLEVEFQLVISQDASNKQILDYYCQTGQAVSEFFRTFRKTSRAFAVMVQLLYWREMT